MCKHKEHNNIPCTDCVEVPTNPMTNNIEQDIQNILLDLKENKLVRICDYIYDNYIPLSSLEKFIEENEKGDINPDTGLPYYSDYWKGERDGHNSALKLLKDKFIHE